MDFIWPSGEKQESAVDGIKLRAMPQHTKFEAVYIKDLE